MDYNWRAKRERGAFLALEDGTILRGYSVGAEKDGTGEVVFNTGLSGYQEILSDPSYAGQFVTMTYPEIGNTGANSADMESEQLFLNGFILHEMNTPSNWRSEESLERLLLRSEVPAIAGIDTRFLTTKIREFGAMKAFLCVSGFISEADAVAKANEWSGLTGQDYASKVSCETAYEWDETGEISQSWGIADELPSTKHNIVAYDFGIKWNILRSLRLSGMSVKVVPSKTSVADVLKEKPDGVFLSNGPADPAAVGYAVENARGLIGKVPVMGICLGHQILGLAAGADRFKLKFGHHGCNHPVMRLADESVEITSQNHNFGLKEDSIPDCLEITHVNLNDKTIEGIRHKSEPMFAVQYHPESSPGPHDPFYLFQEFASLIDGA
ncbi:MAG: glutamine-hydrolyzing carbamoyl-phosphate synthase small subunit [Kiritimatiellaeota bacterium]|nr:glutamine-hydrolyzing carbamoyl-phosphate synthase small subunit [Kiritimatiellota bacterium]